jgi:hypothetical protein
MRPYNENENHIQFGVHPFPWNDFYGVSIRKLWLRAEREARAAL